METVAGGIDKTTARDHDPAGAAPFDRFDHAGTGNGLSRRDLDRAARTFDESDPVVNITDNPVRDQLRMSLRVFKRRLCRRNGKLRLVPGGRLIRCRGGADRCGSERRRDLPLDAIEPLQNSIVGTDRTTASGDVCNKIGTYLKALAAYDNGVPFYAAAPSPSIDFSIFDGIAEVPIETRSALEVTHIAGLGANGRIETVQLAPSGSKALNYAFDVTPARLVTGLITERGVIAASREALAKAFPGRVAKPS